MLHYPLIKVSGATYYEIGKDYGRQAKEMIAHSINDYKQVFALSSDPVSYTHLDVYKRQGKYNFTASRRIIQ